MSQGLTTTGLVVDTTDQTLTKIEADELSTIDPALDTSPTQPLGQLNGIMASKVSDLAQLSQAAYGALDPNNAEGQALDVCCALTGTKRKGPSSTTVSVQIGLDANKSFAGATLDKNGNVVTPGALQAQIAGHPEFVFTNRNPIASTVAGTYPLGGQSPIFFICMQTGAIAANAGTLTVISPSVGGFNSITNALAGTPGAAQETDAALRIRRLVELVPAGGPTVDSLRETLLQVKGSGPGNQGVISAEVLYNDGDTIDANGLPPHSFEAIIWDGAAPQAANNDIAAAIWSAKPAGIKSYSQTGDQGTALDGTGVAHTVPFSRVTQSIIYLGITVKVNASYPSNGDTLLAAALVAFGNTLGPGQPAIVEAFKAQAFTIAGVVDVTAFEVDSVNPPTATTNLLITNFSICRFDTSRVTVTHA